MVFSLYNYPRLVLLMLLFILALGTNAIINMPRLEDPHLVGRIAVVLTPYPGASAERVEALVTERLERKLREIPEVKLITSISRPGISVITVELADSVQDSDPIMTRLRDKLAAVTNLPEGASPPTLEENRVYASTAIIGLIWEGKEAPNYAILGRYARELGIRLNNLPGTDFVEIKGLPKEEITVSINDTALSALNLSASDVAARIYAGDPKAPAGTINGKDGRFNVEVDGSFDTLQRIRDIPLAFSKEGSITSVGDVASVERGYEDPPSSLVYLDGKNGVTIAARMHEDKRIDIWSERLYNYLDEFALNLPASIKVDVIFDQSGYTNERLTGLMGNLIAGALIVFSILIITLGWRASFIAGSILPLATLSALGILYAVDFRIQQMVVTGLIVGLGIMVDNAIVVTDSIQNFLLKGERRAVAVAKTIKRLWLPLLGSTITTILAFLPILLMPGNAGEFVGGISAAVIAALAASYVIAFSIISAIAGKLLKAPHKDDKKKPRVWYREGIEVPAVSAWFKATLTKSLARPVQTVVLATLLPLTGFVLASSLTEQFFPQGDRDQFQITMTLPVQAPLSETEAMVNSAHALIKKDHRVKSVHWSLGTSFSKFYYNIKGNGDGMGYKAEAMVSASSIEAVDGLIAKLQPMLDEAFPAAQTLVKNLEQGPPFDAPVEVRVLGPDLEILRALGEEIRSELSKVAHVTHTRATLKIGQPKLLVRVNEEKAATMGLNLRDIASQLQSSIDGHIGGTVLEETEEIPVRIRVGAGDRNSINAVTDLQLQSVMGARAEDGSYLGIPLNAIAEIDVTPAIGAIPRRDGLRVNTIQGFVENNILPQTVLQNLQGRLDNMNLVMPLGYKLEFGGEAAKRDDAVGNLMATAGVLAVVMVIAVVLTFDSFRLAAVTFGAAILSAGLGTLALWFGNFPLGFVVIIAIMGLVGLSINAAIVILSELKNDRLARGGDVGAIVDGVLATGRHIFSTTLTTVGGFLPLMMTTGEFWPPFAITIAMGTFLSMLVSFFFAPAAFKWMADRRAFGGKRAHMKEQAEAIKEGTAW